MRCICLSVLFCLVIVINAFAPIKYASLTPMRSPVSPHISSDRIQVRLPHGVPNLGGAREGIGGYLAIKGDDLAMKSKSLSKRLRRSLLMIILPFILAVRWVSARDLKGIENQKESIFGLQADNSDLHRTRSFRRKARIIFEAKDDSSSAQRVGRSMKHKSQSRNYEDIKTAIHDTEVEVSRTWRSLLRSLEGTKLDVLILLLATSVVIPMFKAVRKSSILGFLLTGTILGPNGLNIFTDIHKIDILGDLGVVFFLFEMGLDLSFDRLVAMRKDVFGLGTTTFLCTTLLGTFIAQACGIGIESSIALSSSLSLSSSAFVLQLLKDKDALGERFGRQAFGILLLQDLAVVPVLVIIELLSGPSAAISKALSVAAIKAMVTLSTMSFLADAS